MNASRREHMIKTIEQVGVFGPMTALPFCPPAARLFGIGGRLEQDEGSLHRGSGLLKEGCVRFWGARDEMECRLTVSGQRDEQSIDRRSWIVVQRLLEVHRPMATIVWKREREVQRIRQANRAAAVGRLLLGTCRDRLLERKHPCTFALG